eukprot:scaffold68055_cov60-Cyclotella_meneghiniana.AAC.1
MGLLRKTSLVSLVGRFGRNDTTVQLKLVAWCCCGGGWWRGGRDSPSKSSAIKVEEEKSQGLY